MSGDEGLICSVCGAGVTLERLEHLRRLRARDMTCTPPCAKIATTRRERAINTERARGKRERARARQAREAAAEIARRAVSGKVIAPTEIVELGRRYLEIFAAPS